AMFRIVDSLARFMAPLLPFTADEIYEALHKSAPGTVHEQVFPDATAPDTSVLETWKPLLAVRENVLKVLENARAAKTIASSLEASVVLTGPAALLAPLRAHEALRAPFPGNLANLFIVSHVTLKEAEGSDLKIDVSRAEGVKCSRCWTYAPSVVSVDPEAKALCPRCTGVVESLSVTR
ncbi:MAG: class I tRNA ligase family protein, partial [Vicinamibacteria bacterium]